MKPADIFTLVLVALVVGWVSGHYHGKAVVLSGILDHQAATFIALEEKK